jgi:hypothetical protein
MNSGTMGRASFTATACAGECRRVLGFVLGGDKAVGFLLVAGLEGGLLFGDEVFAIEGAPVATEYPVTAFHVLVHVVSMNRLHPPALASSGRVKVIYPE